MIDANRQRSWMFDGPEFFDLAAARDRVAWDADYLCLRSARTIDDLSDDQAAAGRLADQTPMTLDEFGTWAGPSPDGARLIAGGVLADTIDILTLPAGQVLTDMAMNRDGILYAVARDGAGVATIYAINRLGSKHAGKSGIQGVAPDRFTTEAVQTLQTNVEGQPDRVAALAGGGALLLDRDRKLFFQVVGKAWRDQPQALYRPRTPRPCDDGPAPQRLIARPDLQLPADHRVVAMAANPAGDVAVLLFPPDPAGMAEVALIRDGRLHPAIPLAHTGAPFSIGWVAGDAWAVLFQDRREAIVYPLVIGQDGPQRPATPLGYRYPLNWGKGQAQRNKPFVNAPSAPVRYPSSDRNGALRLRPLHHLSFPVYPTRADVSARSPIDSGQPGMVWHRLYLEAHLPRGTGLRVFLAASDDAAAPAHPQWMEHQFGAVPPQPDVPRGVWMKAPSEIPFHEGLLRCPVRKDRAGLFGVLVQRPGKAVRSLRGRYLQVRLELVGNGHESPQIAALRIYGPRFSYLDHYLPELYRETCPPAAADTAGAATGADFLQRFLGLFESVLTPLEDRVAAAYMVTNPLSAPREALDWLAGWIGLSLEPALPLARKRNTIAAATRLYRRRGTMQGLALALDLATDGWVNKGDIVLLEDFRFRRTFATILGADLSVADDPLLMGRIPSANSYVGDTLILGEESKKEFLALYSRDLDTSGDEQEIIDNFYARLANRLTVLVHRDTGAQDLDLIRRIVRLETPAHIEFRIVPAGKPLLVGLYSLVGLDTYLQQEPPRNIARVGHSYLGRNDFVKKLPVLDDRLEP